MFRNSPFIFGCVAGVLLIFFLSTTAVYSDPGNSVSGKDLYMRNCASCHNVNRNGYAPFYPPLLNVKEKFSSEDVIERMEQGSGRMPSFPHLSLTEKETLVSFLYSFPKSLERIKEPRNWSRGGMCPKMMRRRMGRR